MSTAKPQFIALMVMLGAFVLWLGVLGFFVFILHDHLQEIEPLMVLLAGLGIGAVTQFFTNAILLLVQFFARKAAPTNVGDKGKAQP